MRPAPTWCQQAGRRVGLASPPAPSAPKPRHQSGCSVVELGVSGGLPLPPHLPLACSPDPPSPPLQPSRRRATHHFSVAEPEPPRSQSPRAVATQGCSRSGQGAQSAPPGEDTPAGTQGAHMDASAFTPVCKHNLHAQTCLRGPGVIGLPGSTPQHPPPTSPSPHPPRPSRPHTPRKKLET